jgi:hypothetical protein
VEEWQQRKRHHQKSAKPATFAILRHVTSKVADNRRRRRIYSPAPADGKAAFGAMQWPQAGTAGAPPGSSRRSPRHAHLTSTNQSWRSSEYINQKPLANLELRTGLI